MQNKLLIKSLVIGISFLCVEASVVSNINNDIEIVSKMSKENILDVNEGLMGYWSFDFETAEDESGNNNHGTVHEAIVVDGISGRAFDFDGINDYIAVPDDPSLEFGYNDITISFWMKCSNTYLRTQPISKYRGLDDYRSWQVFIKERDINFFESDNGHDEDGHLVGSSTIDVNLQNNTWYHILVIKIGTDAVFYVNGNLVSDTDAAHHHSIYDSSVNLHIGCKLHWEGYRMEHFPGIIDEVRIYNRALSEDEIQDLYTNPAGLETTILIGTIYNLNADAGDLMTFEALKLRSIKFNPFQFKKLDAGEKIRISENYLGLFTATFALGIFKASI